MIAFGFSIEGWLSDISNSFLEKSWLISIQSIICGSELWLYCNWWIIDGHYRMNLIIGHDSSNPKPITSFWPQAASPDWVFARKSTAIWLHVCWLWNCSIGANLINLIEIALTRNTEIVGLSWFQHLYFWDIKVHVFCSIFSGWYVMAPCKKKDAKSKQIDEAVEKNKIDKKCFCLVHVLSKFAYECEYKNQARQNEGNEARYPQTDNISLKLSYWAHFPPRTLTVNKRLCFANESENIKNH